MVTVRISPFQDQFLISAEKLIEDYPDIFSKKDMEEYRLDLLRYLLKKSEKQKDIFIKVISTNQQIVGIIVLTQEGLSVDYLKIKWLIVKSELQHQGYGKLLINEAESLAKHRNIKYLYLETSDEKHNKATKNFYAKTGFYKMGILPDFYPHPISRKRKEDGAIYYKKIHAD